MNESGDRKGGTEPPRPSSPDDDDDSDLARTRANEGDALRPDPTANASEMTLIMERARRTGPRIGQLPPPQLPPFKLPTSEAPPAVAIADQSDLLPRRSASGPTAEEVEAMRPSFELGRPVFAVVAIGAILAGGGWLWGGQPAGIGVGIGALTAALNLWAFTRLGKALTANGGGGWGVLATLKLLVLFGGVFYILKHDMASPLSFLIGYLALPIGIVASQFLGLRSDFENGDA